ncbi:hypothetical protein BOTNAR_0215g00160 [Botryotinia narcissicola]|uniref:Uncharacterized protein n=1 Tax=Botryotinia narcissicola TaxID=278944 RepID=A0A4Z1I5C2_9HELO|nr:hypothetical protein BOTNAR_0215g00160 [Botryotinia narcissicola]
MPSRTYAQDPVAVVGFACCLPGNSNTPTELWGFLEQGGIASNEIPKNRFSKFHYDGSTKPGTMRPSGGMFLENIDPAEFDAPFFGISKSEAVSMDPNQRQMLEVVYEGLENSGIPLESLDGASIGCFVGSFASDYHDIQNRDPEDRPPNIEVGVGRAILSNRISHYLNIKGPSMTIDTACSGSLVSLDVACRYLQSGEISGAIVATSNLYLSPEHVMDTGAIGNAHSLTGKCHTFDAKADGYIKAEAVITIILKRLADAIQDGDPIRAVIRGTATNSYGRTPGIASPSAEAQSKAIRAAYANAGITNFNDTTYLECHGTGTPAGDPAEVGGVASVFSATRSEDQPLIIGSIKSNIGHSEPSAGISGLLKAILAMEHSIIPGNPTFETPNPKIDFKAMKVRATRVAIPWPKGALKRASVNSFGYGGTNFHVVLEDGKSLAPTRHVSSYAMEDNGGEEFVDEESARAQILVCSANDENSLRSYCENISKHLINPSVTAKLPDLAYTLSERRSRHFHRAYIFSNSTNLSMNDFVFGKKDAETPRIGFVFTGQGAQWPQMGKALIKAFPSSLTILKELDEVLQSVPDPPAWSLITELFEPRKAEALRQPEFSQPLVTALQLVIVSIFESWGIKPQAVAGHSSGEIAAAYAAGYISRADAIKAAFYRGRAAVLCIKQSESVVGMLAVGLGAKEVNKYLAEFEGTAQIACFNSPNSVTISGARPSLEALSTCLKADNHFARLLQVDLAYHSKFMTEIGDKYFELLEQNFNSESARSKNKPVMFSSVLGVKMDQPTDASYWKKNMVSPVLFDAALKEMLSEGRESPNFLIEIGPSGALAGPVSQIKKALPGQGTGIQYCPAFSRGADSIKSLFSVAGNLFIAGASVDLKAVNSDDGGDESAPPCTVVDLPNYSWNHSVKYWHESEASKDWRFRQFTRHDLLGSKVFGTSWNLPSWRNIIRLVDLPWLRDHKMGPDILLPASGFISMAIEALYQKTQATDLEEKVASSGQLQYKLRNINFDKALVLEEEIEVQVMTTLAPHPGAEGTWFNFEVSSLNNGTTMKHCHGQIRLEEPTPERASEANLSPLCHTTQGNLWYKSQESIGSRRSRSYVSLEEPPTAWKRQSEYPMHPASIDGCFQTVTPSLWAGDRTDINGVLVPAVIDTLVITPVSSRPKKGISIATSEYTGRGRTEEAKSYFSSCLVYNPEDGSLLLRLTGLRYHKLDTGKSIKDGHTFMRSIWKPDITFLSQDNIPTFPWEDEKSKTDTIASLVAHKKPTLKVMELNLKSADSTSFWLDDNDADRSAYAEYHYTSIDASSLLVAQFKYENQRDVKFSLLDLHSPDQGLASSDVDLLLIRSNKFSESTLADVAAFVPDVLSDGGHVLLMEQEQARSDYSLDSNTVIVNHKEVPDRSPTQSDSSEDTNRGIKTPGALDSFISAAGLQKKIELTSDFTTSTYLASKKSTIIGSSVQDVVVAHLNSSNTISSGIISSLSQSGFNITESTLGKSDVESGKIVLILDELSGSLLDKASEAQWQAIKNLVAQRCKVLWVTKGSQYKIPTPENALVHGLFRSIRAEDPGLQLATLDVESSEGSATISAISHVLKHLNIENASKTTENEFVERENIIFVNRIIPDVELNHARNEEGSGAEPVVKSLQDIETVAMLRAERLGSLESLCYSEMSETVLPVAAGNVEVEIVAAGLNFKDVAVTMGIVPENEYLLGLEASGIIRRIGLGVEKYKPGDRVCILKNGTFSNRVQVPIERVHRIPNSMSFEDAATIPLVYLTSIYSLFNIGNLKKGQSVLIHSATGGVGLSCIQLCQYIGAEIFVTVGTEEKRQLLSEKYGIPRDHMFSSRNTKFASDIMEITKGKGIDVIINSLTGELLDASWRICADGGSMVEIGKKDIVARSYLSMEPFDRNLRPPTKKLLLRDDVSYLIVGGLKCLCGSLAIHMARNGAKHIISMSRSGCSDQKSQSTVLNCQALGCEIQEATGDVSSIEDVKNAFEAANKPIGGVIQGAMVLRDKPFEIMTIEDYHTTVSSKVQGTWNLHNVALKQKIPLDFFTMLSSISGVIGQKGQANYSAGNVFMDAFATYRQSLNLPANAVDLVSSINKEISAQLITGIAAPLPDDSPLFRDARFGHLFASTDSNGSGRRSADDSSKELQVFLLLYRSSAEVAPMVAAAVEVVNMQFTKMLRLVQPMEVGKPLSVYGLDSLSAVEFRNWVRMELGAELTTLDITNASSLTSLCDKIVAKMPPLTKSG